MADIIKLINLTWTDLEGHRMAVTSGQLTEDQKLSQLRQTTHRLEMEKQRTAETSKDVDHEDGEENSLQGRIRRKSVIFNNSIGKHIKISLKRKPTQMMRSKVVLLTSNIDNQYLFILESIL